MFVFVLRFIFMGTMAFFISCGTVTISPEGRDLVRSSRADYSEWKNFWFWGLAGEYWVNTSKICGNRSVEQMQVQDSFGSAFVSALTLGIYSPHVAKVWCKK